MKDKINIAGLEYDITFVKDLTRDQNFLGTQCGNNAEIRIDKDLKANVKEKVLIHEIIEAINCEYELNLEHSKISVLESAIYAVLKNNRWLLQYLDTVEDNNKKGEIKENEKNH